MESKSQVNKMIELQKLIDEFNASKIKERT